MTKKYEMKCSNCGRIFPISYDTNFDVWAIKGTSLSALEKTGVVSVDAECPWCDHNNKHLLTVKKVEDDKQPEDLEDYGAEAWRIDLNAETGEITIVVEWWCGFDSFDQVFKASLKEIEE